MTEAILAALITGGVSLTGVIISNFTAVKKSEHTIRTSQAVTDTKLEELTREVREHNNFARRMPVVEQGIQEIHRTEKHMQQEIDHLRKFHEKG